MAERQDGIKDSRGEEVRTNSLRAWCLAARPKTLSGAAVPVIAALALACKDISAASSYPLSVKYNLIPGLLCLLFAFLMQIDANFINDFYDCINGTDREDRLGPKRACAQGWVSIGAMRHAIAATTVASCITGLPLILYGGWEMVIIGLLCVVFAFLYTTKLSRLGLGDILVLVFFGIVPVTGTYLIQLRPRTDSFWEAVSLGSVLLGFIIGILTDTLLLVNNIRDIEQDRISGKITLCVRIGKRRSQILYLLCGIVPVLLSLLLIPLGHPWAPVLALLYLALHVGTYRKMVRIGQGRELNRILSMTARNILAMGILLAAGILL